LNLWANMDQIQLIWWPDIGTHRKFKYAQSPRLKQSRVENCKSTAARQNRESESTVSSPYQKQSRESHSSPPRRARIRVHLAPKYQLKFNQPNIIKQRRKIQYEHEHTSMTCDTSVTSQSNCSLRRVGNGPLDLNNTNRMAKSLVNNTGHHSRPLGKME